MSPGDQAQFREPPKAREPGEVPQICLIYIRRVPGLSMLANHSASGGTSFSRENSAYVSNRRSSVRTWGSWLLCGAGFGAGMGVTARSVTTA